MFYFSSFLVYFIVFIFIRIFLLFSYNDNYASFIEGQHLCSAMIRKIHEGAQNWVYWSDIKEEIQNRFNLISEERVKKLNKIVKTWWKSVEK